MGNRMCMSNRRRRPVEERMTRPQRLARQPSDVDYKKLRKLILSRKLAPCFDALDDKDPRLGWDLEECPICFLFYPSLNRSRCCAKGICTECFLQMKPSDSTRPAQCPFCKTSCYAVEYHGARTREEKILEEAEEQKVIEAKIRMQCESVNVEQIIPIAQTESLEVRSPIRDFGGPFKGPGGSRDREENEAHLMRGSFEAYCSSFSNTCSTRHEEYAVDLEGVMMMEAIWQSLQDTQLQNWTISQTDMTINTVGCRHGTYRADNIETTFVPSGQNEHNNPPQQLPDPDYDKTQIDQNPHGASFAESDGTASDSGCFTNSFGCSDEAASEPIGMECNSSTNVPSTSNAALGMPLCINDDARLSHFLISGVTAAEQTFTLAAESKA